MKVAEEDRLVELPSDSLGILLDLSDKVEEDDPVDTQRESSGQDPNAGVGDTEGEGEVDRRAVPELLGTSKSFSGVGEERRNDGWSCTSVEAKLAIMYRERSPNRCYRN